ncbi:MAG: hypothetical protein AAGI25_13800 [Bacteroidota bacterium]
MYLDINSDLLGRQIESRFAGIYKESNDSLLKASIDEDFYLDLLCVFNDPERFEASDFINYSLTSILLYLKKTHDLYTSKSLHEVESAIADLSKKDSHLLKLQLSLQRFFSNFQMELEAHIKVEEDKLFPYIETLLFAKDQNSLSNVSNQELSLKGFLEHHNDHLEKDLNNLVNSLKELSKKYKDSFAFRMLVNKIFMFELDLRIHGKIEEEVLIPKAILLEEKLLNH